MSAAITIASSATVWAQVPADTQASATTVLPPVSPPPVAAFARLPFVEGAKLSPDGQWIAGMFAVKGEQRLVVMSPFAVGEAKMTQALLPDDIEVASIQWVDNVNIVVRLRGISRVEVTDSVYVSWAVAYNRETRKFTRLLKDLNGQNTADILWIPSDGSTSILMAGQPSIYAGDDFWPRVFLVDVATGRSRRVVSARPGVMDYIADSSGAVRAALDFDKGGTQSSLLYRKTGDEAFERVSWGKTDDIEVPWWIFPGEARALVQRQIETGDAVVEIDPGTGKALKTVFAAPPSRTVEGGIFDSKDGLLGLYLGGTSEGEIHWIDPALAELQKSFDAAVKGQSARIISLSANRRQMLVRIGRADDPGRLYYYDVDDGKLHVFARLNDQITARQTARVSVVRYKARDGLEIEAIMTTPPGRAAKQLPVVILPHGGPWAQDAPTWDYWAQFIASRGYLVIQPNFRGSTGYGDAFLKKGEGQLGLAMQDDVNDALAWAVSQGLADPKRACVVGASYGGYVAMWGASRDPDIWKCSISIAGVANLRREVNDFGRTLYERRYREQWGKMTPDFAAVSPINFIERIKTPMLLIHGKKDLTVAHGQSQSMYARMKAAGKNVEFVSVPLADHYFTREADRATLLASIESFLARHNPAY